MAISSNPRIRRLLGDEPAKPKTITTDQLGDLIGISGGKVDILVREGVITRSAPGRFDQRSAVRAYCEKLRQSTRRTGDPALLAAKTRGAEATALKLETANALAAGELIPAGDVRAAWANILVDVRAAMLAIPSRLTGLDRAAVDRLDREIRSALEGVADAG